MLLKLTAHSLYTTHSLSTYYIYTHYIRCTFVVHSPYTLLLQRLPQFEQDERLPSNFEQLLACSCTIST
jgi:hypothetical protein